MHGKYANIQEKTARPWFRPEREGGWLGRVERERLIVLTLKAFLLNFGGLDYRDNMAPETSIRKAAIRFLVYFRSLPQHHSMLVICQREKLPPVIIGVHVHRCLCPHHSSS